MPSEARYPIRDVSLMTGVNPVTLRAWQRRYGLIKPARTESGHRLYSDDDIQRIQQILGWLERGVSIGQVKSLLENPQPVVEGSSWDVLCHDLLETAQSLNSAKLETLLRDLAQLYPAELLLRHILEPWLQSMNTLARPDREIIEQSSRHVLMQVLLDITRIQNGPKVAVLSCGHCDILDSLLAQYELQSLECRSLNLGAINPAQLPLAADRLKVDSYVIILGTGLAQAWFKQNTPYWPEHSYFIGEMGRIYADKGWLNLPYAANLNQLVKEHDTAFSLVQK